VRRRRVAAAAFALLAGARAVASDHAAPADAPPPPAQQSATPNPILEPAQRWAFDGFSIEPPQDTHWYSLAKTRSRAVLVRRAPGGTDDSFATVVAERVEAAMPTPEAFVAAMQARRAKAADATRVAAVRHEERLESTDPLCTRYRVQADEVVPWYLAARVTEVVGRACLHPQLDGLVIDAAYAVRAPFTSDTSAAFEIATRFLASLRVGPAPVAGNDARTVLAAARAGDASAAYLIGSMYERGRGIAADAGEAERWYRAAAQGGEADALYNLGAMLERGVGRTRDVKEAVTLFRRASDQRDAQAQLNLGLIYYRGEGIDRDLPQARAFLQLAALNGSARARELLERLKFAE
jgi:TPR repeat protein